MTLGRTKGALFVILLSSEPKLTYSCLLKGRCTRIGLWSPQAARDSPRLVKSVRLFSLVLGKCNFPKTIVGSQLLGRPDTTEAPGQKGRRYDFFLLKYIKKLCSTHPSINKPSGFGQRDDKRLRGVENQKAIELRGRFKAIKMALGERMAIMGKKSVE